MSSDKPSLRVRALFAALVVLAVVAAAEGMARITYGIVDRAREGKPPAKGIYKPYEVLDPTRTNVWLPRANYQLTLAEAILLMKREGFVLAEQNLVEGARSLAVPPGEVIFRINADSYKGPDLDRAHTRPRVLAIGDSCTFGSLFDHYAWPRSAERTLATLGVQAEVVNAGVNGYAPIHALARLEEFRALDAAVAVINIGWNGLYDQQLVVDGPWRFLLARFARGIYGTLEAQLRDPHDLALEAYHRPKHPDPNAPALERLAHYEPSFLADVAALARGLEQDGTRVFVTTLPGLYQTDEPPSARALEIGHLPQYTDNPYVVARLADGYNVALRAQASAFGAAVIDLDAWSRAALRPRDDYFVDSVHLTAVGQEMVGAEIARAIAPALGER